MTSLTWKGKKPEDGERSPYFAPVHAEDLAQVKEITKKGRALMKAHYNMPYRVQTVSVRLLEMHAGYADLLAEAMAAKARGEDDEADRLFAHMKAEVGKDEVYFQTCYDHGLAFYSLKRIFDKRTQTKELILY